MPYIYSKAVVGFRIALFYWRQETGSIGTRRTITVSGNSFRKLREMLRVFLDNAYMPIGMRVQKYRIYLHTYLNCHSTPHKFCGKILFITCECFKDIGSAPCCGTFRRSLEAKGLTTEANHLYWHDAHENIILFTTKLNECLPSFC